MPYGTPKEPGSILWAYSGPPVTVGSPALVSPWLNTEGFSRAIAWFNFAGGTSVHSIEQSFDGVTADGDFTAVTPTSDTEFVVRAPFIRWRTDQSTANGTKSKLVLRARA
jgi:hypothetical protein